MQFQKKENMSIGQNSFESFNSFPGKENKRSLAGEVLKVSSPFGSVSYENYSQDQKTDIHTEENLKKNLNSFQKRYYTSYSKLSEVKIISIGMASPLRILQWAEKTLPNGRIYGEVLNANTLHHKTFKPQKGGLFCERIFGPLKDFECACGKIDKSVKPAGLGVKGLGDNSMKKGQNPFVKNTRKFCPDCDVEYTWSVIRRYQLGYIKLNSPVLHVWFMKGTPSYLSILLDMKKRHLQNVAYCSETLTLENSLSQDYAQKALSFDSPSKIFSSWQNLIKNPSLPNEKLSMETRKGTLGNLPFETTKQGLTNEGKTFSRKETLTEYRILKRQKTLPVRQSKNFNKTTTGLEGNGIGSNLKVFPILERKFSFSEAPASQEGFNQLLPHTDEYGQKNRGKGLLDYSPEGYLQSTLGKNHSMFKFLNALQYSIYHDSRALKNTESFKMYTSKSEGSSLRGRVYDLNSDPYKVSNTLKNSLMIWNKILKNLPMDLYILCSIERMHHKKIIFLSISQKWQKLYKQAYYKAMYKATKILKTSLADPEGFSKRFLHFGSGAQESQVPLLGRGQPEGNLTNPTLYTYNASALYLNRFIQTTKAYFKNYVLLKLKTIIQPIDSFYLTTHLNCNSSQIIHQLSKEMEKNWDLSFTSTLSAKSPVPRGEYVLGKPKGNGQSSYKKDTPASQVILLHQHTFLNKLSFYFLRPLLIILYLEQKALNPSSVGSENAMANPVKGERLKRFPNRDFSLEGLEAKITDITSSTMPRSKRQTVLYKTLVLYIQKIKNQNSLAVYSTPAKQGYSPGASFNNPLKSLSEGFNREFEEDVPKSPRGLSSAGVMTPETGNVFIKHIPLENTGALHANRFVSDSLTGNQISDKYKNQQSGLSNTIYTLSHRERWNAEKDWLYFLLYNTVSSEYTDLPIYAYKSRLFGGIEGGSSWTPSGASGKTSFSFLNFGKSSEGSSTLMEKNNPSGLNSALGGQSPQGLVSSKMESVLSNAFFSGPGIVQQLLKEFSFSEIKKLDKQNRLLLYQLNIYLFKIKKQVEIFFYDKTYQKEFKELCKKRDLLIRRTKFVRKFFRKDSDPSSMILTVLPVLPPDLRPIVKMGNQIAASDLNRLYQRVIYRNERLKKFLKDPATSHSYEMKYAQRLLQEAVDNLIINGKNPSSEKDSRNRPLKSLSDILKGKQGRFRQFLLGKRVDYSGRSVIVVGPKLKLHECGIPLEMALELYLPFLLKIILNKNYAKTVIGAKSLIKKNPALAQELLREIMQVSPVLLNRAPTLHRLGFQAFVPKLVTGRAILLHPLVCSAFNADFDGDQMAVHVPITVEARAEAWKLMLARNNILSPATGEPLAIPSQDMVLGCYYLTTLPNKIKFPQLTVQHLPEADPLRLMDKGGEMAPISGQGANVTLLYFKNIDDVLNAYNQQKILVHSYVWVKWTGFIENGNDQEEPIEIRISPHGQWQEISANYHRFYDNNNRLINIYMVTTPGRILFNYILQNKTP